MHPSHEEQTDFRAALRTIRRRLWIIVLCIALSTGGAIAYSELRQKEYTADATLLFRDAQLDQKLFGSDFSESRDDAREAATNLELVSVEAVAENTSRKLNGRLSAVDVSARVEAVSRGQSDVVTILATHPNPQTSADLANAFASAFVGFRRDADREKIADATDLVRSQLAGLPRSARRSPEAQNLQDRLQELQILASLQTGNVEVVDDAEPPATPSSPRPVRNAVIGFVVGLLTGLALAFLRERFDRRMRDADEVQQVFHRPILAAVPAARDIGRIDRPLPSDAAESFRMLRATLRYFNVEGEVRSVVVTSAEAGDGKSTIAWHLAWAAASAGQRVLLVEADLRQPSLASRARDSGFIGLSTLLSHQARLQDAVRVLGPARENGDGPSQTHTLDVVFAGPLPPNPDELMESGGMAELIATAERGYDLVIIDTPPASSVSDALPIIKLASGVLVVGRIGSTSRDAAARLADQLVHLNARVLGVVVNAIPRRRGGYGYSYGYGHARPTPRNAARRA